MSSRPILSQSFLPAPWLASCAMDAFAGMIELVATPMVVFERQPDSTLLVGAINRIAAEQFGVIATEIIGHNLRDALPAAQYALLESELYHVLETGHRREFEEQIQLGQLISHRQCVITPLSDDHGAIHRLVLNFQDISRERQLDATLHMLQSAIETATSAILLFDRTRPRVPIIFINSAFSAMTGFGASEALQRALDFLYGPGTAKEQTKRIGDCLDQAREATLEIMLYRRDGTPFWCELRLNPVYGMEQPARYMAAVLTDITARRDSERFFDAVYTHSGAGIAIADQEGKFVRVNAEWLRIFGYREDEMLGEHFAMVLPSDQRGEAMQRFRDFLFHGTRNQNDVDWEVVTSDGARKILRLSAGRFKRDERARYMVMTVIDITETRRLEKLYRAVVEDQTELICRYLPDTTLTFVNGAYARYFGRRPEDFVGKRFIDFVPPDEQIAISEQINAFTPQNPIHRYESQAVTAYGSVRWQLWIDRAFFNSQGQLLEFQSVGVDITDRKRLEEELRSAKAFAEEASKAKSRFLAHMSHELRTPLNAILGFSDVIKEEMFGQIGVPRYKEYAADIFMSGQHLLALINDVLDLSRLEAGRMELRESVLDLAPMIGEIIQMVHDQARRAKLHLEVELNPALPRLYADGRAVRQMLLNLLSNAMKFTPPDGRVILRAYMDAGQLVLSVADTGMGIKAEDHAKVLEPFGQVGNAQQKQKGAGLGLAIVKQLLELHGGQIRLFSELGRGTEIQLHFPSERLRPNF